MLVGDAYDLQHSKGLVGAARDFTLVVGNGAELRVERVPRLRALGVALDGRGSTAASLEDRFSA
eukprot:7964297-Lingulodinium_polyedra.AAC.1